MTRNAIILCVVLTALSFSIASAMPPHPEALAKIRSGQAPMPIFMEDPKYFEKMGINQPHSDFQFSPDMPKANWNTLVVLVDFPDLAGIVSPLFFDTLMFAQTYHTGPSLRQFYNRASYGNLDIVAVNLPSALGWQTMTNNRRYYTALGGSYTYGMGAYPNNSQKLCEDLLLLIDPLVNFANYDNNGDSYVDGIVIIHAGREGAISLDTLDIWSHRWALNTPLPYDGVYVYDYCVDSEYRYVSGDATVGTFAHEFGHILGLPDLYDYSSPFDAYGLGYWSLMAYGGWNGSLGAPDTLSGVSPAFLDAWSRVKLGFVTPTEVACYTPWITIPAVEDSAKVYKLWTYGNYTGNEYFLVENRYQTFTDTALAAWGLLIYHIDDNQTNNDNQWWPGMPAANHYMVALEQADHAYHLEHGTNGMDYTDPFWQNYNYNFGPNTSPSSRDYYLNDTYVSVTNITQGYTIFADLDVGNTTPPVTPIHVYPYDLHAYNYSMMDFQWDHTPCAKQFYFQLGFDASFYPLLYEDSTITTNYKYVDLSTWGQANFCWRVKARNEAGWSDWTWPWQFITDFTPPYGCVASSPDTAHASSFLVSWTAGNDSPPSLGINSYTVYCKIGTGGWNPWIWEVDALSCTYTGAISGNKYYFEAFAKDSAGNFETFDFVPECSTYVTYETEDYAYLPGDANMDGKNTGNDVTYLVNFFRSAPTSVPCYFDDGTGGLLWASADANGSCDITGNDVTKMVNFNRSDPTAPALLYCNQYEPLYHTIGDVPNPLPEGWPFCDNPVVTRTKIISDAAGNEPGWHSSTEVPPIAPDSRPDCE
jgi:M6 family metalloprotease-like protein